MKKPVLLRLIAVLSAAFALFLAFFDWVVTFLIQLITRNPLQTDISGNAGIIGGADGPTAIYITSSPTHDIRYLLSAVFAIITILAVSSLRKKRVK